MAKKDLHTEWLSLLEVSGPFLNVGVLSDVFPQGLDEHDSEVTKRVRLAYDEWADDQLGRRPDPQLHEQWLKFVLTEVLEFDSDSRPGTEERFSVEIPEHRSIVTPSVAVVDPESGSPCLLVALWPADQSLDEPPIDSEWAASPLERMTMMSREHDAFGLVTNGRQWTLVTAQRGEAPGYASWYSHLWTEEPLTLRAFRTLLGARRFFAAAEDETLDAMLKRSALTQEEITAQLGKQVRSAVEVLVQAVDRADLDSGRQLVADVPVDELYEAAVTVMMRLVFLFSAEERGLLLLGEPLYDEFYAVSPLGSQLRAEADLVGVEVLERRFDAWSRLCAIFRAVHGGVEHDRLRLVALGGSLFDPDRFPFLEGRQPNTSWLETEADPLPIDNRTVLHLLEALQILQERGREPRRLSFRALDVEQIGHIYEGLLDHRALRVDEPYLGLQGAAGLEPEVPLSRLETSASDDAELVAMLRTETKRSESALSKRLDAEIDTQGRDRLKVACGGDEALFDRVRKYAGLLREDVWGYPLVYPKGTLLVTAGLDRRSTQTYYTPRALAEEIVQYTLEPLAYVGPVDGRPREEWQLRSLTELFGLRICDPTMGSGAFLVAACRWLAERVVEAWAFAADQHGTVTIDGEPSNGAPGENLVPTEPGEQITLARRLVAERCLYGVDVNPFAVEMAKLSLWLVTLAKDRPFGFLDHALKCGDSLLGVTNLEQLRRMHLGDVVNRNLWLDFEQDVMPVVAGAARARSELESFPVLEPADVARKRQLHAKAEESLGRARLIGDVVVACALAAESGPVGYDDLIATLSGELKRNTPELPSRLSTLLNTNLPDGRPNRLAFHWPLEFPEVFGRDQCGFDAVVANPPFLGGQRITGTLGTDYREYLVKWLVGGNRGSADLSAYFLARFAELTRQGGTVGSLATNSIGQGVTRDVGLSRLLEAGRTIYRAVQSRSWPGSANLEISELWFRRGAWVGEATLDDRRVVRIDSSLSPGGRVAREPERLNANRGWSFQGSIVLGAGFVLDSEEAERLWSSDPRNREVVLPYLGGRDVTTRVDQSASRAVIYFRDWAEPVARTYVECFDIVETRVRPERAKNKRKARRERWWQFAELQKGLYAAIADLDRVLVKVQVSSTWAWVYVPNGQVYDQRLVVFRTDGWGEYGVLQSFVHREWMWRYSSTLRTDDVYTPGNIFETYPFPIEVLGVRSVAEEFHEYRAAVCRQRDAGLTAVANLVDDPDDESEDVVRLRMLQTALDRAVVASYGWHDLQVAHEFRSVRGKRRFAIDEKLAIELSDRLLELNHERHQAEQLGQAPLPSEPADRGELDALPLFQPESKSEQ